MSPSAKQILVVEDERIVQLHLAKIVQASGHSLVGAVSRSQAAIDLARQTRPDLVLMDIRLAEGDDGIECAKVLVREHGASILFITAHSGMETLQRAMPVAAAGYLVKPFRVAEVTASIAAALAAREKDRRASSRERALSSAVDALEEAIFVLDAEGCIGFANPRGKQLARWSESDGEQLSLLDCVPTQDREKLSAAIARALDTKTIANLEGLRFRERDSQPYQMRLEPIAEAGNECLLVTVKSSASPDALEPAAQPHAPGARLLVYSHDTFGLGHIRRCMNLIQAMSERIEDLCTLLVTGSPMAHKFELPPRTDYLKLPAVRKVAPGAYEPRSLAMSEEGILNLRRNLLLRTIRDYSPSFLLVDHSPTGMNGELLPALEYLRAGGNCQRILGLRDIIDSPLRVSELWQRTNMFQTMEQNYDHIVVYGSKSIYDTTSKYDFPEQLKQRTRHVNYVSQRPKDGADTPKQAIEPGLVVVTIGGGDGGADTVVQPFLEMMQRHGQRLGIHAEVLLGPFVGAEQRQELHALAKGSEVLLHDFIPDPTPLFARAELVISTAGYNICAELLAHAHRALLIPRVVHREEQLIRAQRLAELGYATFLHPNEATPEAIAGLLEQALASDALPLDACREAGLVDLDGAQRMADFVATLVPPQA